MEQMSQEDKDRLVAVFEWLLKEDKKQNPENYIKSIPPEIKPPVSQPLN